MRHNTIQFSTTSETEEITGLSYHRKDAPNSGSLLNETEMFRDEGGGGGTDRPAACLGL